METQQLLIPLVLTRPQNCLSAPQKTDNSTLRYFLLDLVTHLFTLCGPLYPREKAPKSLWSSLKTLSTFNTSTRLDPQRHHTSPCKISELHMTCESPASPDDPEYTSQAPLGVGVHSGWRRQERDSSRVRRGKNVRKIPTDMIESLPR